MSLTVYIRCSCYMFRSHMGHHQATFIIWGDTALYSLSLVPTGTSLLLLLLLLLLLICFVGYFHHIFVNSRFTVMYYIYISMTPSEVYQYFLVVMAIL
jgi:hypothetical protein